MILEQQACKSQWILDEGLTIVMMNMLASVFSMVFFHFNSKQTKTCMSIYFSAQSECILTSLHVFTFACVKSGVTSVLFAFQCMSWTVNPLNLGFIFRQFVRVLVSNFFSQCHFPLTFTQGCGVWASSKAHTHFWFIYIGLFHPSFWSADHFHKYHM